MNVPNWITIIRVLMTPVFLAVLLSGASPYWAMGLFLLAAATDGLDGYIARKYNLITNFGKFADPLADKLLVGAALIGLCALGQLNPWYAFIIIAREFIITGLRLVAAAEGTVLAAGASGKVKTVLQIVAIAWRILDQVVCVSVGGIAVSEVLLVLAVILTVYSGAEYLWKNRALITFR